MLGLSYLLFAPFFRMEGRDRLHVSILSLRRTLAALPMSQIRHQQEQDLSPSHIRMMAGWYVMRTMGVPRVSRDRTLDSLADCSLAQAGRLVGRMRKLRRVLSLMKEVTRLVRVGAAVGLVAA
jgi:hypothetical protein